MTNRDSTTILIFNSTPICPLFAPFALRRSAGWRLARSLELVRTGNVMLSSGRTPSGPSPHLSSEELKWHRWIQDSVVPLLGEGVVCAMRDQPNDPAAYLAEFLAAKSGSAEMARTLSSRKLAGECARLDAELKALHEQLQTARAEAQRRLPNATLLEAVEQKESDAAASWSEMRRLKKLVRSMKLKAGVPLDASEWLLPEGVVLVQVFGLD